MGVRYAVYIPRGIKVLRLAGRLGWPGDANIAECY